MDLQTINFEIDPWLPNFQYFNQGWMVFNIQIDRSDKMGP